MSAVAPYLFHHPSPWNCVVLLQRIPRFRCTNGDLKTNKCCQLRVKHRLFCISWWAMENRSALWSTNYTSTLRCLDLARNVDWKDASILSSFIILGIIDILVIGGNTLVVMAVFLHSKLRSVTNLFIVSLAVADLLVGIAVLPFSTCNEVLHFWLFGEVWCKMWLAVDVWLCTASILNLCAISLDRYLAVTRPVSYPSLMSSRRAKVLIAGVWCISFIICLPPLVGWNDAGALLASEPTMHEQIASLTNHVVSMGDDEEPFQRIVNITEGSWLNASSVDKERENVRAILEEIASHNGSRAGRMGCQCQLISDKGYRIYSALGSFYLPMLVMMFFYWRIYRAAVETTRAINQGFKTTTMGGRFDEQRLTLRIHRGRSSGDFYGAKTNGTCPSQQSSFRQKDHHSPGGNSSSHLTSPPPLPPKPKKYTSAKGIRANVKFPSSSKRKICAVKNTKRKSDVSDNNFRVRRSAQHQWLMVDHETVGRTRSSPTKESIVETEVTSKSQNDAKEIDDNTRVTSSSEPPVFPRMGKRNIKAQVKRFRMETKAAKTLGIIVGGFILCWLPFFTIYLVGAFCDEDSIPESLFSVFFWLGYCNSAINPCVYALFSRDFRYAFKKILCRCFLSDEISIKERIVTMFPPTIHLSSFGEESEGGSDSH